MRRGHSGKIIAKNLSSHYKKSTDVLFIFKKLIKKKIIKNRKKIFFSQNPEWGCIFFIKFEYFEDLNYQNDIWEKVRGRFSRKIIAKIYLRTIKTIDILFIKKNSKIAQYDSQLPAAIV